MVRDILIYLLGLSHDDPDRSLSLFELPNDFRELLLYQIQVLARVVPVLLQLFQNLRDKGLVVSSVLSLSLAHSVIG